MNLLTAVVNLGVGVVIAVVTAVATVRLALRRFYTENWWTRRFDAYHAVLESLHHIREYATTHLAFEDRAPDPGNLDLSKEGADKLSENLQAAIAELRKQFDIGSFLLCEEAIGVLKRLMLQLNEFPPDGNFINYLKMRLTAVDECLAHMRRIARADLKAPR